VWRPFLQETDRKFCLVFRGVPILAIDCPADVNMEQAVEVISMDLLHEMLPGDHYLWDTMDWTSDAEEDSEFALNNTFSCVMMLYITGCTIS